MSAVELQRLHEEAVVRSGLDDFGDPGYRLGLGVLLESLRDEPRSEHLLRQVTGMVVNLLVARLHSERQWRLHPEWQQSAVVSPLVIIGLPRTGTTALHHLLSVDEQFQWLPHWITVTPRIRPRRDQWAHDPAYQAVAAELEARHRDNPRARSTHNIEADRPEECLNVMAQSFTTMMFVSSLPVPRYHEWFLAQDEGPSYRRYRDNLMLIGLEEPTSPWLLKNPSHTFGIASLLEVFPDARVVMTYRDPVESIPSGASTIAAASVAEWEPGSLGRHRLRVWAMAAERAEAGRRAHPERFHEVDYRDFVSDPLGVAEGIYARFGLDLPPLAQQAMHQWVADNPQGKHGEHRYTPQQFGLDPAEIRDRFSAYIDRYRL